MKHNTLPHKHNQAKTLLVSIKWINLIISILLAISVFGIMIYHGDYLRKVESLSLFLPSCEYFHSCLKLPGGLLIWISTFLTQSMHLPWLGALSYILIFCIWAWIAIRAFRIPEALQSVIAVVPVSCVLAFLNMGYIIFSLKTPGFAFLLPIGIVFSSLLFWTFRISRYWWSQLILIVAFSTFGYIALGAYAFLTVALCVCYSIFTSFHKGAKIWQNILVWLAAACVIWFPRIWMECFDVDLSYAYLYTEALPRLYEGEQSIWTPYIIIAVVLIALSINAALSLHKDSAPAWCLWPSAAVGVLSIAVLFTARFDDPNFRLSLSLDRHIWDGQYHEAVHEMANFQHEPTRMNVILSSIALIRSGEAADRLFTLPNGDAPYPTQRSIRVAHDAVAMLYAYHMGMINYAYRWAMEGKVEYGMNVEQLKIMAKCALLNGELPLAQKCLQTLRLTAFHKDWADYYLKFIDSPEAIGDDPELRAIKPLIIEDDKFIDDHGNLEGYVWSALANVETGGKELLYLSLVSALISREIDAFAERLPFYARLHDSLPVHFQEGILAWSMVHENFEFKKFKIDPQVLDRFKKFVTTQRKLQDLPVERQREMLRPSFGDTYWFYALYLNDLKVI